MDPDDFFAGPHRCRRCPATFSTRDKLERHVEAEHPSVRALRVATPLALVVLAVAALVVLQPAPARLGIDDLDDLDALHVDDDPTVGDVRAPLHVVVFEASSCADCRILHDELLPDLMAGPVARGEVAIHFLSAPSDAAIDRTAGIAQECTHQEGRTDGYLDFTGALMANGSRLNEHQVHELLEAFSVRHNVPEEVVMRCYYAEESAAAVEEDWRVARTHDATAGTVFLVQDGRVTRADVATLWTLVDSRA